MKKETRLEFKKQFVSNTKNIRVSNLYEKIAVIKGIIIFESFGDHLKYWINIALKEGSRKKLKFIEIYDNSKFTMEDYEFILWYGFVNIYNGYLRDLAYSNIKHARYSINQRMCIDIFDSPEYSSYLDSILNDINSNHKLYGYIKWKRYELLVSDRQYVIKKIMRS